MLQYMTPVTLLKTVSNVSFSGPKLNKNDVVLAVSSQGLFFLDEPYKISKFYKYYEIVDLYTSR